MDNEIVARVALAQIHKKQGTQTKTDEVILLLWKYRNKKVPVYKLVYDLRCHRFWSIIHRLRKEWWNIATVYDWIKDGQQMYSYVLYI